MIEKKTPMHKRVRRAEDARDQWKVKATNRREENEGLKTVLERRDSRIKQLEAERKELESKLEQEKKVSQELTQEIKKKQSRSRDQAYWSSFSIRCY